MRLGPFRVIPALGALQIPPQRVALAMMLVAAACSDRQTSQQASSLQIASEGRPAIDVASGSADPLPPLQFPHLHFASEILLDSGGGYLVHATAGDPTFPSVRRYLPNQQLDLAFLDKTRRFLSSQPLEGGKPISPHTPTPLGSETLFFVSPTRQLAVSPDGAWRVVTAEELAALNSANNKRPDLPSSSPCLTVSTPELVVRERGSDKIIARTSALRADETVATLRIPTSPDANCLPFSHGVAYLRIDSGAEAYNRWRQNVGADDFGMMPPAIARKAMAGAPPEARLAGALQARLGPNNVLGIQRITFDSLGDIAATAQTENGDFAFVHQGSAKAVYRFLADDVAPSTQPILAVNDPAETIDILRFFSSTTDKQPVLIFTVRNGTKLRVMVAAPSDKGAPRSIAEVDLGDFSSGITLLSDHKLVWYSNVSQTPDQTALHVLEF